jgi:Mn2+/Fe2+ NRAMP family transporter
VDHHSDDHNPFHHGGDGCPVGRDDRQGTFRPNSGGVRLPGDILSYLFSAFLAEPDWVDAAYYTVTPTIDWHPSYLILLLALIGSTIAPWQHFYLQASVVEKGVPKERYWETRMDVLVGSISCMAVVFFIIVSAAATLNANGITQIKDAAEAAAALEPFAGHYASTLFAFGLLNASLFAASILPLSTAYVICEGLGVESGLDKEFREAPFFYWLYTALIVVGAGLILLPGTPLVRIMVLSQAVNAFLLPAVLVFMLLLINRTDLMGSYRNSGLANFVTWGTVIIVSGLTLLLAVMGLFDFPGASQLPPG